MNETWKRRAWDFVRPIHAPITRGLRRRLGRNYFDHPEMELPPPYESIQLDLERHLHQYLHVSPQGLEAWNRAGNALFVKEFGKLICK